MSTSRGFKDIFNLVSPTKKLHQKSFTSNLKKKIPPRVFQFSLFCINLMLNSHSLLCLVSFWRWKGEDGELFQKLVFSSHLSRHSEFPSHWKEKPIEVFRWKSVRLSKVANQCRLPWDRNSFFKLREKKNNDRNIVDCVCGWWFKSRRFKMPSDDIDNRIKT